MISFLKVDLELVPKMVLTGPGKQMVMMWLLVRWRWL
jgi:hypothetical protein